MNCTIGTVRVKPGETEHFRIDEFTVSAEYARSFNLREMWNRSRRFIKPGTYTKLSGTGRGVIMSNTPAEIADHREAVDLAHGDVFVAGLGIGMVLEAILSKGDMVNSITVLEIEPEIITLTGQYYAGEPKVSILCGDAFNPSAVLPDGKRFDFLYFDIWDSICGDNYEAMKTLNRQYRKHKAQGAKAVFWCRDLCKREHFASERRYSCLLAPLGGRL